MKKHRTPRAPIHWKLAVSARKRWLRLRRALRLARPGEFLRCSYYGANFLVQPDDGDLVLKRFEWFQISRLIKTCETLRPTVFIDIGANVGIYTCIAGHRKLARRLIAFEPDRVNLVHLKAHLMINSLLEGVELYDCAAGAEETKASLLSDNNVSRIVESGGTYQVKVVPLDAVIPLTNKAIAIKIDVEGHEMDVLAGAKALLTNNHGYAQIEALGDQDQQVIPQMEAFGWHLRERFNDDLIFEKP